MKKYVLLLVSGLLIGSVNGQDTFTAVDGFSNWSSALSWTGCSGDPDCIPDANDNVIIPDRSGSVTLNRIRVIGGSEACNNLTIDADFNSMGGGAQLRVETGLSVTVNGILTISGSSSGLTGHGSVNLKGTATIIVFGATTFNDNGLAESQLIMSNGASTADLRSTVTVAALNCKILGGVAGSTVNFNATVPQNIPVNGTDYAYDNIEINNTSGSGATLQGALTALNLDGDIIIASGILDNGGFTITTTLASTTNFKIEAGGKFRTSLVGGFPADFDVSVLNGTVEYDLAGAQTISDQDYGSLMLSVSGVKTLPANSTVTATGLLTINGTATLDMDANVENISVGAIDDNNTTDGITNTTGTITFTGAVVSDIDVAGSGTVTYGNVDFQNTSGTRLGVLGGALEFTNVTLSGSGILDANNNGFNITGNWSNSSGAGTPFVSGSGIANFTGATTQTIGGSTVTTFGNLTVNKSANGLTLNTSANLEKSLTLTLGSFTTTGQVFTVLSTATRTGRIAEITGGSISGPITMQRFIDGGRTGWHNVGIPVGSSTVNDWDLEMVLSLVDGNEGCSGTPCFDGVKRYNAATDTYVPLTSVATALNSKVGYFVYTGTGPVTTAPFTFDAIGTPNTGSQTFTIVDNATDYNLIANPYPSAITGELNDAGWTTRTNVAREVQVWNPNQDPVGYQTYVNGVSSPGGWDGQIAASQAFWVRETGASPALVASEAVKTSGTPDTYYKSSNQISLMRLALSKDSGYIDEAVIRFDQNATTGLDNEYDAQQLIFSLVSKAIISTVITGSPDLVINALPELTSSITVPVRVTVVDSGSYTISLRELSNIAESSCLVLEDLLTSSFTNLKTDTSYTFTIDDTTTAPRFLLHVQAPLAKARFMPTCKGSSDGMAIATGQGTGPWSYTWVNSNGDTVRSVSNVNGSDTLTGATAGTYTIHVTGTGAFLCTAVSDTLLLMEPSVDLTPIAQGGNGVSCFGGSDGSIDIEVTGGIPPYNYSWSSGDTTQDLSGLVTGSYDLNITDDNGCLKAMNVFIAEPNALMSNGVSTDVTCFGDNDGELSLSVVGGTSPYAYLWSTGDTIENVVSLAPGAYSVVITDANNCMVTDTLSITEPAIVSSMFTAVEDTVYISDGGALQYINNSNGAIFYEWDFNDGSPMSTQTSPLHVFVIAGSYNVSLAATNSFNCTDTSSKTTLVLNEPIVGMEEGNGLNSHIRIISYDKSTFVDFTFSQLTLVKISVLNSLGQKVITDQEYRVSSNRIPIKLEDNADGIYFIRISTNESSFTQKIMY